MLGKVHSLTLAAAVAQKLPGGRYLRVMTATSDLTLTFFDSNGQPIGEWVGVLGGFALDARDFKERINLVAEVFGSVSVESATDQSVEIAISRVPVIFDRMTGEVTATKPTDIATAADVSLTATTTTQVLAADTGRRAALISNLEGNANSIRIGDSNTGSTRGAQVGVGQTITIEGTEAIYAYSTATQSVGVTTIRD